MCPLCLIFFSQAFLEFSEESQAAAMVNCHSINSELPASIRGRTVYIQYSTHKELKTEVVVSFVITLKVLGFLGATTSFFNLVWFLPVSTIMKKCNGTCHNLVAKTTLFVWGRHLHTWCHLNCLCPCIPLFFILWQKWKWINLRPEVAYRQVLLDCRCLIIFYWLITLP